MDRLSHVDDTGKARMVNVGGKEEVSRRARARGKIRMSPEALTAVRDNQVAKGDVLTVAQIAGIQAAKETASLIPLCHPLVLDGIDVHLCVTEDGVEAESEVRCVGRTGVEMEALTAVSVALLAVYDMCKAIDKAMSIGDVRLVEKVKGHAKQG